MLCFGLCLLVTGLLCEMSLSAEEGDVEFTRTLQLHAQPGTPFIRAVTTEGALSFELSAAGIINAQGLRMESGGIHVNAGGLQVEAGGIRVKGGLAIESGEFKMNNQRFSAGKLSATSSELLMPLIEARAEAGRYIGNMINLDATSTAPFNFLSASRNAEQVFSIESDGSIISSGRVLLKGGLTVGENSLLQGSFQLNITSIYAGDEISIPPSATYVEILEDNASKLNKVVFSDEVATSGRFIVVSNMDSDATTGVVKIPSNTSIMLFSTALGWRPIDALKAPLHALTDVSSFIASNDLNIGNFTLEAGRFQCSRLTPGSILVSGAGGVVESSEGISYTKGILAIRELKVQRFVSDIDVTSHTIKNAVLTNVLIESGSIRASNLSLSSQGTGIAIFEDGVLSVSTKIRLEEDGSILLKELKNDINANSYTLMNANIKGGRLLDISDASVETLRIQSQTPFSLLTLDSELRVVSTTGISFTDGELQVAYIGAFKATGHIDANNHEIINAAITGGHASNLDFVGAKSFKFTNYIPDSSDGKSSFVVADSRGELRVMSRSDPLILQDVSTKSLEVNGDMNINGNDVKDIKKLSANLGSFKELIVSGLRGSSCGNDCSIVGANSDGTFSTVDLKALMRSMANTDSEMDKLTVRSVMAASVVVEGDVTTETLKLPKIPNALLGTNASGSVKAVDSVSVRSITVEELSVRALQTSGAAQFMDDVFIHGSVSVEGSVIGSGPYVDSSDMRLKKNVERVSNALESVCALTAVLFDYNIDEFPTKNFPSGRQIGWIADEVNEVLPGLVVEDRDGFKAVAYARATAVVAEAVKELRTETHARLADILLELRALRAEVDSLTRILVSTTTSS